jgi:hypothetical protein
MSEGLRPSVVVAVLALSTAAVLACSSSSSRPAAPAALTAFPGDYRSWKKLNRAPILREAEREARDLFANPVAFGKEGDTFPVGSVLVKEERALQADPGGQLRPGDATRLSVMFKVGQGSMTGWSFKAFDPATRKELPRERVDPDGCYFCHADASARDYVFSTVK